ncbi:MAG TPA: AprI/Inh family metalloprotease inhibitor [Pseudolabrys sp.]|nr:AprI/Inh family metalloprotease inhibitor [Pseudolabrys sp.]
MIAALVLAGCAADQNVLDPAPSRDTTIPGRWILSAPGAPSCGLEFGGAGGTREGIIAPDGGCPGNFYLSRHWSVDGGGLTITGGENQVLAQLKSAGRNFEGISATGIQVTLSR